MRDNSYYWDQRHENYCSTLRKRLPGETVYGVKPFFCNGSPMAGGAEAIGLIEFLKLLETSN